MEYRKFEDAAGFPPSPTHVDTLLQLSLDLERRQIEASESDKEDACGGDFTRYSLRATPGTAGVELIPAWRGGARAGGFGRGLKKR